MSTGLGAQSQHPCSVKTTTGDVNADREQQEVAGAELSEERSGGGGRGENRSECDTGL